jgi:hypothetical protein
MREVSRNKAHLQPLTARGDNASTRNSCCSRLVVFPDDRSMVKLACGNLRDNGLKNLLVIFLSSVLEKGNHGLIEKIHMKGLKKRGYYLRPNTYSNVVLLCTKGCTSMNRGKQDEQKPRHSLRVHPPPHVL